MTAIVVHIFSAAIARTVTYREPPAGRGGHVPWDSQEVRQSSRVESGIVCWCEYTEVEPSASVRSLTETCFDLRMAEFPAGLTERNNNVIVLASPKRLAHLDEGARIVFATCRIHNGHN